MPIIVQRQIIRPATRLTWAQMYARARQIPGAESALRIPDGNIEAAVQRAVDAVSAAKCLMHEQWYARLDTYTRSVPLPWSPSAIMRCSWQVGSAGETEGMGIPHSLWEVEGRQWRFLGSRMDWPAPDGMPVLWFMEAVGPPVTIDDDPLYCPIEPRTLLPMIEAELKPHLMVARGIAPDEANDLAIATRQATLASIPAMRVPAYEDKDLQDQVNAVYFMLWGDTSIKWGDFT
jgi:hypothetical protein